MSFWEMAERESRAAERERLAREQGLSSDLLEQAREAYERMDYRAAARLYSQLDERMDDGKPLPRRWELMREERRREASS